MKLYQATSWRWSAMTNNTYYDDNNRIVYKVHTPFKFTNRTTTITKTRESEREHISNQAANPVASDRYEPGEEYDDHTDSSRSKRHKADTKSATSSIDVDEKRVSDWAEDVVDADESTPGNESVNGAASSSSLGSSSPRIFEYLAQIDWRVFASSKFRLGDGAEIEAKAFFRKEGWGPYGRHRVFTAKDGREYKWYLRLWYSELAVNNEGKTPVAKFNHKSIRGKRPSGYLEIFPAGEHMVDELFTTFIYIEKLRKEKERAAK
ncbi:hypothetical protein E1B28_002888 [Marasmius oreades]|uniref:DUF6593 domain-containing protein n=1 Tax=Marasmius oreades TaxID=181124 RepID=A0A9P7ULE0_9AGAR|nr:uncharacterized protein E1B28_002888 [Marasmius oreades]KAG7086972.1 hypothetical protein E1B28_002888 [Marasmius oreades]